MDSTRIETMIWHIQRHIMDKHGVDYSYRAIAPLNWYINTGRASAAFLDALYHYPRYFMIARDLCKGGSDEEIIDRICNRIGYERCA